MWSGAATTPMQTYTDHLAAVKAIAWSPHHHGLLASGGGTADRYIRFETRWNLFIFGLFMYPVLLLGSRTVLCQVLNCFVSCDLLYCTRYLTMGCEGHRLYPVVNCTALYLVHGRQIHQQCD